MPKMLNVSVEDLETLKSLYVPQFKNGGLFIRTDTDYHINEQLFVVLKLLNDDEKVPTPCTVAWVNPDKSFSPSHPKGVGVMFDPSDNGSTRGKIETLLAGHKTDKTCLLFP